MCKTTLALITFAVATLGSGCEQRKAIKEQLYFDDLKPPLGIRAQVVSDVSLNQEQGGVITVLVAVDPNIDRDDLDRLVDTFWRQLKDRGGFRKGLADRIDLRFYGAEAKARAAGADWLAQASRSTVEQEPTVTNRQKLPLVKWASKALGKQPQFTGKLQPQILADPTALELHVKVPFVKDDGTGAYVDQLTHSRLTTEFSSYARTLFDQIEQLRKLTFEGLHADETVVRIWLSREQYQQLDLRQVEESLGAYQGQYIEPLMSKAITSEQVEKKVAKQRLKVYRETFARLPRQQVVIDKRFR